MQAMLRSAKNIVAFYHRLSKGMEKAKGILQVQLKLPDHKLITNRPT